MDENKYQNRISNFISLSEASQFSGISRDYLNVLIRRGKLRALKEGKNWLITKEWLSEYTVSRNGENNYSGGDKYISLFNAAKLAKVSPGYLNVAVRRGRFKAVKIGRNWFTTREWISDYQSSVGRRAAEFPAPKISEKPLVSLSEIELQEKSDLENLKAKLTFERELAGKLKSLETKVASIAGEEAEPYRVKREKQLAAEARVLLAELKIKPREHARDERKAILDIVAERMKKNDALELERVSRELGAARNARNINLNWAGIAKISLSYGLIATLMVATFGFTSGLMDLPDFSKKFESLKFSISKNLNKSFDQDYQAAIFSNIFKNFPNDIPLFADWIGSGVGKTVAFFGLGGSETALTPEPESVSHIPAGSPIDTLSQANALDSFALEPKAEETPTAEATDSSRIAYLENRIAAVENNLSLQKQLITSGLSVQNQSILELSKLVPTHPISTFVTQGQPSSLASYAVYPVITSGFDHLSADYLNLAHDANINGALTVKSGANLDSLSVSGNSSFTGNTAIKGNLTVDTLASVNQLAITGTATTTFNGPISSTSGVLTLAGQNLSDIVLNPTGGNVGIGTSSPVSMLTVNGNAFIGGTLTATSSAYLATLGGNVGIGTTSPGYLLSVNSTGNVYFGGELTVTGTTTLQNAFSVTGNADIQNGLDVTGSNFTVGGNNFVVTQAGAASSTSLSVTGNADIQNGLDVTGSNFTVGGNNFVVTQSGVASSTSLTVSGDINLGGNLNASGSSILNSALTLGGTLTQTASSTNSIFSSVSSSTVTHFAFDARGSGPVFNILKNNSSKIYIDENGNVGIATTTPSAISGQALTVQGNQFLYGGLGVGMSTTTNGAIQTSGDIFVGRNLYVAGDSTTIGDSSTRNLIVNARVSSDLVPYINGMYGLGSADRYWGTSYITTLNVNNLAAASSTISGTNNSSFTINSDNGTVDAETSNLIFFRGVIEPNATIKWNSDAGKKRFELNQAVYISDGNASTTNPTLTVQGVAVQTANLFQLQDSTGANVFTVNPGGNVYAAGNVGIGTTTPNNLLTLHGDTTPALNITTGDGTGGWMMGIDTADSYKFKIASSSQSLSSNTRLTIDGNGNVGIGTTSPTFKLEVANSNYSQMSLRATDAGGQVALEMYTPEGSPFQIFAGNGGSNSAVAMYSGNNGTLFLSQNKVGINGTVVGVLNTFSVFGNGSSFFSGNIGIGTTTPNNLLTIHGDVTPAMNITTGDGTSGWTFGIDTADQNKFKIASSSQSLTTNTRLTIDGNGNVGIGTTSPLALLHISKDGVSVSGSIPTGNWASFIESRENTAGGNGLIVAGRHVANKEFEVGRIDASTGTFSSHFIISGDSSVRATLALQLGNSAGSNASLQLGANTPGAGGSIIANVYGMASNPGITVGTSRTDGIAFTVAQGITYDSNNVPNGAGTSLLTVLGNGLVGIGTTTPNNLLTIHGDVTPAMNITTGDGTSGWTMGIDTADQNKFKIASSSQSLTTNTRLTIDGNGNVGIGTTTPDSVLSVVGLAKFYTGSDSIDIGDAGSGLRIFSNGNLALSANNAITLWPSGNIIFHNSSAFTNQNRLGVNTTGPLSTLDINGGVAIGSYAATNAAPSNGLIVSGNVGIGTTTPNNLLTIHGDTTPALNITAGDGTSGWTMGIDTADQNKFKIASSSQSLTTNTRLTIDSNGNVGIGTTSPLALLHISKDGVSVSGSIPTGNWASFIESRENTAGGNGLIVAGRHVANKEFEVGRIDASTGTFSSHFIISGDSSVRATLALQLGNSAGSNASLQLGANTPGAGGSIIANVYGMASNPGITVGTSRTDGIAFTVAQGITYDSNNVPNGAGTSLLTVLGNGLVGIGTTTPNNLLTIHGDTTPALNITAGDGTSGWTMGIDTADGNKFKIASSSQSLTTNTRLTIDGNGNVGIGMASPGDLLHLLKTTASTGAIATALRLDHTDSGTPASGFGHSVDFYTKMTDTSIQQAGSLYFRKADAGNDYNQEFGVKIRDNSNNVNEAFKINMTGNGTLTSLLGTTTIQAVNGTYYPALVISQPTSNQLALYNNSAVSTSNSSAVDFVMRTSSYVMPFARIAGLSTGISDNDVHGALTFSTFDGVYGASDQNEWMRINHLGNVGIASTSPSAVLSVNVSNAASPIPALNITNATGSILFANSAGNVGIGTAAPGAKLDVRDGNFYLSDADVAHGMTDVVTTDTYGKLGALSGTDGGLQIVGLSDTAGAIGIQIDGIIGSTDPTDTIPAILLNGRKKATTGPQALGALETVLRVDTQGTSGLMTILGSGNVGIGTTAPNAKMETSGAAVGAQLEGLRITNTDSTAGAAVHLRGQVYTEQGQLQFIRTAVNSGVDFVLALNNVSGVLTEYLRVTEGGNVGIGTTAPTSTLQVLGSFHAQATGGAPGLYMSSAGNVGIGTTNPSYSLTTQGDVALSGSLRLTSGGATVTYISESGGINLHGNATHQVIVPDAAFMVGYGGDSASRAAGTVLISGLVGIGTTTPNNLLTLHNDSTPAIGLTTGDGNSGWTMGIDTADANKFKIASSTAVGTNTRLTIDGNGKVGIGTTAPTSTLQVIGTTNIVPVAGGNSGLYVNSTGVGIGTTGPGARLSVSSDGSSVDQLEFITTTAGNARTWRMGAGTGTGTGKFGIYDVTGSSQRVTIDTSGNVGIGTTAPTSTLQVLGSFHAQATGGAPGLYMSSAGNVGIGTAAPGAALQVYKSGVSATGNAQALFGTASAITQSNGVNATLEKIEIGGATVQSSDSGFAGLALSTNQTGINNAVGTLWFLNNSLGTGEKRLGQIAGGTDGATNSGTLIFSTLSAGTFGERMRITNIGNVGIGTTTPNGKLVVSSTNGPGYNTGDLVIQNPTAYSDGVARTSAISFKTNNPLSDIGRESVSIRAEMTPNTGVTSPQSNLRFFLADNTNGLTEKVTFLAGGNVGIGTTSPATTFSVAGSVYHTGGFGQGIVNTDSRFLDLNHSSEPYIRLFLNGTQKTFFGVGAGGLSGVASDATVLRGDGGIEFGVGNSRKMIIDTSGNVGIGTTNPGNTLDVQADNTDVGVGNASGQFQIRGNTNSNQRLALGYNTTDDYGWIQPGISGTAYKNLVLVPNAGNVGIGTTTPGSYKLNVAGTGYLNTAAWVYASDIRMKEKISYLNGGLDKILQLKPTKFDYISGEKNQLGFIAQEVLDIIPEAVVFNENSGMFGLKNDFIIPYLVNAVQELNLKLDTQNTNFYPSLETIDSGDIVTADISGNVMKATSSSSLFGVYTSASTTAFSGKSLVKISLENGPVSIGDRITISSTPGVGMKATATSTSGTVGIALESFDGWTSPSSAEASEGAQFARTGKIMVFVNLGQPQVAAKSGTIDLMTASSDINMNGYSLLNVKSVVGASGLWSIDEGGNIRAQSVETIKGVTTYDTTTGQPFCIRVTDGQMVSLPGKCEYVGNTTTTIINANDQITPVATTTPEIIMATTTPEIITTATSTPTAATTTP